jgi:short subunit dehydrogenase-like uncharacterized protein
MKKAYDIVIYGATGFTGRLVVEYFISNRAPKGLKWAIAGRNKEKLADLQQLVKEAGRSCDLLMGSDKDVEFVKQARLVIAGVGPYWKRGESVARACVAASTHYLDYTGQKQCSQARLVFLILFEKGNLHFAKAFQTSCMQRQ